jgi:hypothetical protein
MDSTNNIVSKENNKLVLLLDVDKTILHTSGFCLKDYC